MIRVVPRELVADLWPHFGPMLKKALEFHPFLSLGDLEWLVTTGRADLIADTDGRQAAVLEVMRYPSVSVANVVALAGHEVMGTKLHSLLDFCEEWGRARGCTYFAMIGRPGWSNFIPKRGGQVLKQVQGWKLLESPCLAAVGT